MAVQQAAGHAYPRIHALGVAINLDELNPEPFLDYLQKQVEYYVMDKGHVHPDFGDDEIWVDSDEKFTLAYQDGEFRVFEGLETEEGAVELFEIWVRVEGTETSGFDLKIQTTPSDEDGVSGFVRDRTRIYEPTDKERVAFSKMLRYAIKSYARLDLERILCGQR